MSRLINESELDCVCGSEISHSRPISVRRSDLRFEPNLGSAESDGKPKTSWVTKEKRRPSIH